MNIKDAYVIAHASPFEDEIPDYLVDDFQMPMKFKSIEEATNFILSIAPIDFDLSSSLIKIYRIH